MGPQWIGEEAATEIGRNAGTSEQDLVCDESNPKKDPEGEVNENSENYDDVDKLKLREYSIIFE